MKRIKIYFDQRSDIFRSLTFNIKMFNFILLRLIQIKYIRPLQGKLLF